MVAEAVTLSAEDTPALAALLDAWEAYQEYEALDEDVIGVLHQIGLSVEQHLQGLERQIASGEATVDDPVVCAIGEAFVSFLKAVKMMLKQFEPDVGEEDTSRFEIGFQLARQATQQLIAAHSGFLAAAEEDSWVFCISCRTRNKAANRFCNCCHLPLPKSVEMVVDGKWSEFVAEEVTLLDDLPFDRTENYDRLEKAFEAWLEDRSQRANLLAVLKQVMANTEEHLADNQELKERLLDINDTRPELWDVLEQTDEALETAGRALQNLSDGLQQKNPLPPILKVRLKEYRLISQSIAKLYFALKQAHEN